MFHQNRYALLVSLLKLLYDRVKMWHYQKEAGLDYSIKWRMFSLLLAEKLRHYRYQFCPFRLPSF